MRAARTTSARVEAERGVVIRDSRSDREMNCSACFGGVVISGNVA